MQKVDEPKAARVGIDDAGTIIEGEDDVVMGTLHLHSRPLLEIEFAQIAQPAALDHRNAAGQLGPVTGPAADGLRCRCGETGCLETVASGWALVERLRAAGDDVHHVRDLVAAAGRGNGRARAVVRESGRHIGEALAATVTVLNPRAVVVGGDMAGAFDTFSAGLREGVFSATTALAGRDLQVVPAAYGDRAGLVGCVRLALDSVLSPRAVDAALAR